MEYFSEYNRVGEEIQNMIGVVLYGIAGMYSINYKRPVHDIARSFLNEIEEFEAYKEDEEK